MNEKTKFSHSKRSEKENTIKDCLFISETAKGCNSHVNKILIGILTGIITLSIGIGVGGSSGVMAESTNGYKGTWEWNATTIDNPTTLINSLTSKNLSNVVVNCGYDTVTKTPYLKNNVGKYDTFIKQATSKGIKVEGIYSNNDWALTSNYTSLANSVKEVLNFNATHKNRFSAIHLDIEPYLLSDWQTNSNSILQQYVSNLSNIRTLINSHNKKYKDTVKLVIDIPFWFNQYNVNGKNCIDSLLEKVDKIVVMDYTKNDLDFKNRGVDILNIADKYTNKKIVIASEFQADYTDVTLYDKTLTELDSYNSNALSEFQKHTSFDSLSAHDLESYSLYLSK